MFELSVNFEYFIELFEVIVVIDQPSPKVYLWAIFRPNRLI